MKVLVVEDHAPLVELVRVLLDSHGFDCDVANDPDGAWESVAHGGFDVVVTDLMFGGRSGWDLIERIRAGEATAGLRVIVMSGSGDRETEARARALGCEFLLKPFAPQALVDLLEG